MRSPSSPLLVLALSLLAACAATEREVVQEVQAQDIVERCARHIEAGEYDVALEQARLAAIAALAEGNRDVEAQALARGAHAALLLGRPKDALPLLQSARERTRASDPLAYGTLWMVEGEFERVSRRPRRALAHYRTAFEYSRQHQLLGVAVASAHLAGVVTRGSERLAWAERALDVARQSKNPLWQAHLETKVGRLELEEGRSGRAEEYFASALNHFQLAGDVDSAQKARWARSHALRLEGRASEARAELAPVLLWSRNRYASLHSRDDVEWFGRVQEEYGELEISAGRIEAGLRHLEHAQRRYEESDLAERSPREMERIEERIAELRGTTL